MKPISKNIKAFTILEVVFSLAIMSIIIAMVYIIFTMLSKQLYTYSEQTEHINNYNQLHTVLTRDLHNAKDLSFVNNELLLIQNNDSLTYTYQNNALIRAYLKNRDTFLIPVKSFSIDREKELLNNKLKCLNVTYNVFNQELKAVYFKDFGVSNQVNKLFFKNGN